MATHARYADLNSPLTSPDQDIHPAHRHNARVGIIVIMPMSA